MAEDTAHDVGDFFDEAFGLDGAPEDSGDDAAPAADVDSPDSPAPAGDAPEGSGGEAAPAAAADAGSPAGPEGAPEAGSDTQDELSGGAAPAVSETDETRRLRDHVGTQEGRLRAAQEENRQLQERLARLEARFAPEATPDGQKAPPAVALPENLSADAARFDQQYPGLAGILREPGPDGETVRAVLEEYGPVLAGQTASNISLRRDLEALKQSATASRQETDFATYAATVGGRHPEVAPLLRGGDPAATQKATQFRNGVLAWIYSGDQTKVSGRLGVINNVNGAGTADAVCALLDEYKQTTSKIPQPKPTLDADARRRAEEAAAVDDRRVAPRPKGEETDANAIITEVFGL